MFWKVARRSELCLALLVRETGGPLFYKHGQNIYGNVTKGEVSQLSSAQA